MSTQGGAHGRGDGADAHLDGRAVGYEVGHELADPTLDFPELADEVLVRRHVALHGQVDLVHVDEAVAE